ncbi:MAG: pyrroloquinoline quinone-dependent dehydrogenase [Bryobacteraceae bacterium]
MRLLICGVVAVLSISAGDTDGLWPAYGHDPGGTRFSPLAIVNRQNVTQLKVAWTFHTGDLYQPKSGRKSQFESTPLFMDGTLFVTTPFGRVIALDPDTGRQRWSYDPKVNPKAGYGDFANRGASTWSDGHQRRIFIATIDARLIALDAATGQPCADFGDNGQINLKNGLRLPVRGDSEYEETSPPAIIGDIVIVGSGIADNDRTNMPSGEVRAYDVRTGRRKWTFDPMPGTLTGAANAWSIISVDPERNLVFIPTGSASPDYYGGMRKGDNRYANSVVALRGDTGEIVWSFQTVHHDLWDYDVASQPILYTMNSGGKSVPAIAVGSKTGNLFLLNRETGKPLFGVEERRVPRSRVPGEESSPTQPFPLKPGPLVPQALPAQEAWGATEESRKWCADKIAASRSEGIFTPPSVEGTIAFPGNVGGMHWGSAAFDPVRNLLIIPTNRLAMYVKLIPRAGFSAAVKENGDKRLGAEIARQTGTPYAMSRQSFLSPQGTPCNRPPWGTLAAIDVNTAEKRWEVPLGIIPWLPAEAQARGLGSINLGGPITTAGGLVFIGATLDPFLRAFDTDTGKELWKGELPASARSMPMTYRSGSGKQYVVIAAGGHDVKDLKQSDALVAFALEDK